MLPSLTQRIETLFTKIGVTDNIVLNTPPNPMLGDIAIPCFTLTTDDQKNPAAIAAMLSDKLQALDDDIIENVQAAGPYINLTITMATWLAHVLEAQKEGWPLLGIQAKNIVIEYPSNNTHKEFHIGHLRNVCIGNTLTRLFQKAGHTVVAVNYLNDFGSHVAKCLWGVLHAQDELPLYEPQQKWLGEMYALVSSKVKEDEAVAQAVSQLQQQLEAKDPALMTLFEETREESLRAFTNFFAELGVHHDDTFYESQIKAKGQALVDTLLEKNIATIGEGGAVIIDLEQYNLHVALLRKSDGTGLYLTSDLPLAQEKFTRYPKTDESIVLTGKEQNFYFKQLYTILDLMGYEQTHTHIGYGLVTLPDGKMSSRTGKVVLYEELRDSAIDKLTQETQQRHPEWDQAKVTNTACELGLAALKFTMLQHDVSKDIVFDMEKAISVEGYSAPYVMYSYVRVQSMKNKWGKVLYQPQTLEAIDHKMGKQLLRVIASYPFVLQKAITQYNPSVLSQYAFDIAQSINGYYAAHQVITTDEEQTNAQLFILDLAAIHLKEILSLLSIETLDEM